MFFIARRFGVSLQALIAANPHITNPNLIFPGDVLCVPGPPPPIRIPCCLILSPQLPLDIGGVSFVHPFVTGGQGMTIVAVNLPPPSTLGNFDIYLGQVLIPGIGGFGTQLFPTPEVPPTFAGTFAVPRIVSLTPDSRVEVLPSNSQTGVDGPVVLAGTLTNCLPG